jgi:hypothetical protein
VCVQMPSHLVARVFNRITLLLTVIFAVSFRLSCFLSPRLCVNSAASVFSETNYSPRLHAHSTLLAVYLSIIETTWLISLPIDTQPKSSTNDSDWSSDKYSSNHLSSREVYIAKRIGDTGVPCRTLASTGSRYMALPWIIISAVQSGR